MQDATKRADDGTPLTFREGPSDPIVSADGPGTWAEIHIAARIDDVWTAVTDIDLPTRFSEEFLGATWKTDGPRIIIRRRIGELHANMVRTVEGIRRLVEAR